MMAVTLTSCQSNCVLNMKTLVSVLVLHVKPMSIGHILVSAIHFYFTENHKNLWNIQTIEKGRTSYKAELIQDNMEHVWHGEDKVPTEHCEYQTNFVATTFYMCEQPTHLPKCTSPKDIVPGWLTLYGDISTFLFSLLHLSFYIYVFK